MFLMRKIGVIMTSIQYNLNPSPNRKISEIDELILKSIQETKHMCRAKKLGRKKNENKERH